MRKIILIGIGFLCFSCSKKIEKDDLHFLNGYWEIEKVTFPDGNRKDYTVSTSIDYIDFSDFKGFRKKVQPSFDGTYSTSNDAEFFTILEKDGVFELHYKNDLSEWHEQLVTLSENEFSVRNQDNLIYAYRKYEAINALK